MSTSALLSTSPLNVDSQRPSMSTDVSNGVVSPHTRDNSIPRRAGRQSQRVLQPRHDALPPSSRLSLKHPLSAPRLLPCAYTTRKPRRPHLHQRLDESSANYHLVRIPSTSPRHSRIDGANSHTTQARIWADVSNQRGTDRTRREARYVPLPHLVLLPLPLPSLLPSLPPSRSPLPVFALRPQPLLQPDSRGGRGIRLSPPRGAQRRAGSHPHAANARRVRSASRGRCVPALHLDASDALAKSWRTCRGLRPSRLAQTNPTHSPSLSLSFSFPSHSPLPPPSSPRHPTSPSPSTHRLRARRSLLALPSPPSPFSPSRAHAHAESHPQTIRNATSQRRTSRGEVRRSPRGDEVRTLYPILSSFFFLPFPPSLPSFFPPSPLSFLLSFELPQPAPPPIRTYGADADAARRGECVQEDAARWMCAGWDTGIRGAGRGTVHSMRGAREHFVDREFRVVLRVPYWMHASRLRRRAPAHPGPTVTHAAPLARPPARRSPPTPLVASQRAAAVTRATTYLTN
ncbi:hypothetical protein DFH06DRAFT_1351648 [Mycena polygramma]|nr:hypothetical protein DFH06DRAFT_1351619 [Mycena polygramma]KAJ7602122.1 hypothetical protein DFH06DRAFT_1398810 [Mycena polygramma]KAJ7602129.1 hypothetical protein DFH06DRAFT_1398816 [Mycena polygramma]KAJ7602135.1 hypothetical protein DFH06DRAFT_1398821 [Mycena polygramma]KAJ7602145.1 hypothetical protein DFH06DRAFT_1351648 [Mycena polygramma]